MAVRCVVGVRRRPPCCGYHQHASLEELGRLAVPPLTKDAVAGRLRRLLSLADRVAHETGVPDTASARATDLHHDH